MTTDIETLSWPSSKLDQALEALSRIGRFTPPASPGISNAAPGTIPTQPGHNFEQWLDAALSRLDMESEHVHALYPEIETMLRQAGPALLRMPNGEDGRFIVLLCGNADRLKILDPALTEHWVSLRAVRDALCRPLEQKVLPELRSLLDKAKINTGVKNDRALAALVRGRLSAVPVEGVWLIRGQPGADPRALMREAHLVWPIAGFFGLHALQYGLWLLAWFLAGKGALQGSTDAQWLLIWGLVLLTRIPILMAVRHFQGSISIGAGMLLKRRLLAGALKLEPEEIRHQGVGQLFGRVADTEAAETLALDGGLSALQAIFELILAAIIVASGLSGGLMLVLLLGTIAGCLLLGWDHFRKRRAWSQKRLDMTHDLVEKMVGHQTRLAQELPEHRHESEDKTLEQYLQLSRHMDNSTVALGLIPRIWLLAAIAGIAPGFMLSEAFTTGALGAAIGGTLLAYQSFATLAGGLSLLADAAIAWRHISKMWRAAGRPVETGSAEVARLQPPQTNGRIIEAKDLKFTYRERGVDVLKGVTLNVETRERILLEGPSGGGKSTLCSLIAGLRAPASGLLLLNGLDHHSLGLTGWRRQVAMVPQFHENHVLADTFAFNLLMGRRWPPTAEDLQEADVLCKELGLGPLLERMPAGLFQIVGETGWQLSHGEQSRLFIARALLQDSSLLVLDESFGALDPENLAQCLDCVLARSPAMIVVAHP